MRAIELQADQTARVVTIERPTPRSGEVVVRVEASGVCGSDLTALRGIHPFRIPPLISGHEAGGEVVELGANVTMVRTGDRVVIEPQVSCGVCATCLDGYYHLCPEKVMLGIAAWPGSFAEYVCVPESTLHLVGPEVTGELLAIVEPLAVAAHSVRQAGDIRGSRVAVLGGGPIGSLIVHQAAAAGAGSVTATDPRVLNRELCLALGATWAFDPLEDGWLDVARTSAGVFDVVFVAATAPQIVDQAVAMVRPGGTVVQVALFGTPITFAISALQMAERRLVGSNVYSGDDFRTAIAAIQRDPEVLGLIINGRGGLEAGAEYLNSKVAGHDDEIVKFVILPHLPPREGTPE